MKSFFLLLFGLITAAACPAASPDRDIVSFSIVSNVGLGNNIHVVGNHPDLGAWNPVNAIKLRWTTGNVWTGQVAVQKGTALEYKFMSRSFASNVFCDGNNAGWEGGANRTAAVPAAPPAPYPGKTIFYYTSWTNPSVIFTSGANTNFFATPMVLAGPGRSSGENLFRAGGVGVAGEWLQFVITDNNGQFDKSPFPTGVGAGGNDYLTRLDALLLQDGHLFNYWPSNSVSAPRVEYRSVGSSFPPIDGRNIVIILPRGYDSHPWKRYPVMYFQDGQKITNGANDAFNNGAWDADVTAQREAAGGRMREVILVGIDNIPDRRRWEYNPLGDQYPGESSSGRADAYLNFLVNNVRPTLDFNYRTLNDPRNTMVAGSSMGGIFSLYAGLETNVFGGILAMSPAVTRAPNYRNAMPTKTKRPMKVYIDTGTAEGQVGTLPGGYYWDDPWTAYDHLQTIGYIPNQDIIMRVGCGHVHNEVAWRARLPEAFRFLLDVRDEPNRIAQQEFPPEITAPPDLQSLPIQTQRQFNYQIETTTNGVWSPAGNVWIETNAWDQRTLSLTNAASATLWLRVSATAAD
jgi:predicted alpha/beta superfamily hydrolase